MSDVTTEHEPWPLLADLDALMNREGWSPESNATTAFEYRIASETGVGDARVHDDPTPFLQSRDAAAMLEEAVLCNFRGWINAGFGRLESGWYYATWHIENRHGPVIIVTAKTKTEATSRTRAALEAGWHIGIWPK